MDQCRERERDGHGNNTCNLGFHRVISGLCQDIHTLPFILGFSYQNRRPNQLPQSLVSLRVSGLLTNGLDKICSFYYDFEAFELESKCC